MNYRVMVIKIKANKHLLIIFLSWDLFHKYSIETDTDVSENHEIYCISGSEFKHEDTHHINHVFSVFFCMYVCAMWESGKQDFI